MSPDHGPVNPPRKRKPKLDPIWSIVILAVGALAVWLAWNSGDVARLWPS